ncbi:MAG: 3-deoxy-manno-octulosonate cytidylyltransferase [Gammaproteobacteria bacterium]|nr:3-deoxy-manno-octulosonate cytidylyltransferase [Gammaproteobacteria bacterium]
MAFRVAIPARFDSQRLPGKPLREIAGKPLLQHVYEQALRSGAQAVIIATDDPRIEGRALEWGATVCMTSRDCASGSERLAEAARALDWPDSTIVVNVQGDEPLLPPANIRQVALNLAAHPDVSIASLCTPIQGLDEFEDPNVVKVVRDATDLALYFSRAPIPWSRERGARAEHSRHCYRHVGLYAYRVGYLKTYAHMPSSAHEAIEHLEQLRALWRGDRIHVALAAEPPGPGVDTPAELAAVEAIIAGRVS